MDRTFKVDEKVDVQAQVRAGKRLRLSLLVKDGLRGVKAGAKRRSQPSGRMGTRW